MMSPRLYSLSARLSALTVSIWGAVLGLFAPSSLTARIHDTVDGPMSWLNLSVIAVALLGFADVGWHDLMGRLIWPSLDPHKRHRVCVLVYAWFGATWMVKAFVAAGALGHIHGAAFMMGFALSMACICGVTAVALTLEQR